MEKSKKQINKLKLEIYKLQCIAVDLKVYDLDLQNAYDHICDFEKELIKAEA